MSHQAKTMQVLRDHLESNLVKSTDILVFLLKAKQNANKKLQFWDNEISNYDQEIFAINEKIAAIEETLDSIPRFDNFIN